MKTEPTRQIHLDFHTSEHIPDIAASFRKEQFQEALRLGRVNQINVFAKCHHSWSYYPTSIGTRHPNLTADLLGQQIEACHEIGVAAPIYVTGGWSAADAEAHPEWCMRDRNGGFIATDWPDDARSADAKPPFQWKELCVSGAYHQLMLAQTEEICRRYEVDGFFYDIYRPHLLCYCDRCRAAMTDEAVDLDDLRAVEAFRSRTIRNHTVELSNLIRDHHRHASIFFNGLTTIEEPHNIRYGLHRVNTKNDLEDLPTTWGGYDKFPLRSKIFHREGKPVVAMSGKFHTAWGEFGGFKDPAALRFEAATMIAFGASCNFGDQLHPNGEMDVTTYRNIGHAYGYVEQIEAYGVGGVPTASLGLWASYDHEADEGLTGMLLDEQIDFAIVQPGDDLSRYRTIVVPSVAGLLDRSVREIEHFVRDGGSLVLIGDGALRQTGDAVAIACGGRFVGRSSSDVDYTVIASGLRDAPEAAALHRAPQLPVTPFLNYRPSLVFLADRSVEILATIREPYFNRTYGRYCGHQNAPDRPQRKTARPAAWRSGRVIVHTHALDRLYHAHGAKVHRDFFTRTLRLLHTAPMIEAELPSAGRVSLLHQADCKRYAAHLLYGVPVTRGGCVVIEDTPPLFDVTVRMRVPQTIRSLELIPEQTPLAWRTADSGSGTPAIETVIPRFTGHCAIVARY